MLPTLPITTVPLEGQCPVLLLPLSFPSPAPLFPCSSLLPRTLTPLALPFLPYDPCCIINTSDRPRPG